MIHPNFVLFTMFCNSYCW